MSDPYSPYPQQQSYYAPPSAYPPQGGGRPGATGSSRAASVLMALLALGGLLLGALFVLVGAMMTPELLAEMQSSGNIPPEFHEMAAQSGQSLDSLLRIGAYIFGGFMLVYGVVVGGLSPFVWGNRKPIVITAIVVVGLVLALLAVNLISAVASSNLAGTCFNLVFIAPHVAILVLLIMALRSRQTGYPQTPTYDAANQQAAWQAYYAQQQQYQQDHSSPPPPPPPPGQGPA